MLRNWVWGRPERYSDFVWRAATDSGVFAGFRSNKAYTTVLEHVTPERGRIYLEQIANPVFRDICLASAPADEIGAPATMQIEGAKISPSTCRYAKVADEIVRLFPGFGASATIIEIGIGYGGQARIIAEWMKKTRGNLSLYTFIDLPEVNLLAKRYIEHFFFDNAFEYLTVSELDDTLRGDFLISNYAFSELSRATQEAYMKKVISRTRSGYITMNSGRNEPPDFTGFTEAELLSILPNAKSLDEFPLTGKKNYIVVFGDHTA